MRRTFCIAVVLFLTGFDGELQAQITLGADLRTGALIPISTSNDSYTQSNSRSLGFSTELRGTFTKQLGIRSKVQYAIGYQQQWFGEKNKSSGLGGSTNDHWKVNAGWLTLGAAPIIPLNEDDLTRLKFGIELVIPLWAIRTGSITYSNGAEDLTFTKERVKYGNTYGQFVFELHQNIKRTSNYNVFFGPGAAVWFTQPSKFIGQISQLYVTVVVERKIGKDNQ
ncbi:MAG: hypothetical protein KA408_04245 [Flavobacteriales bacterium]|nr:hypothetical protein [Flavobacteriales bacterium]